MAVNQPVVLAKVQFGQLDKNYYYLKPLHYRPMRESVHEKKDNCNLESACAIRTGLNRTMVEVNRTTVTA